MVRLTEAQTIKTTPGIGEVGKVVRSNHGTRAIMVMDSIMDLKSLGTAADILEQEPPLVNRRVMKAVSKDPLPIGAHIGHDSLKIEASIGFPNPNNPSNNLFWVVAGENLGERVVEDNKINEFKEKVRQVKEDPKYEVQAGKDLVDFARGRSSADLYFVTISPENFSFFENALRLVYAEAFTTYPYDVVNAIRETCDNNIYVAVADRSNDKILGITGAEITEIAAITIAEIGDSASLKEARGMGLGPLIKRYLLQTMLSANRVPDLSFTDSRIANDTAVLKANRRAGLQLDNDILLPYHTEIASDRDPGDTKELLGEDGERFQTEHMTMTYITKARVGDVLDRYGTI